MFSFHKNYFIGTVILFLVEVFIGFYMHDAIVRPYGGDFLVVILLYCLVKSFTNLRAYAAAVGVLVFSYLIETFQSFQIVNLLGLEKSKIACTLIGTYFAWGDLLAYTLGILAVLGAEATFAKKSVGSQSCIFQ
jgi:hypothetical protein